MTYKLSAPIPRMRYSATILITSAARVHNCILEVYSLIQPCNHVTTRRSDECEWSTRRIYILNPQLQCGRSRICPLHESLHSSKRYSGGRGIRSKKDMLGRMSQLEDREALVEEAEASHCERQRPSKKSGGTAIPIWYKVFPELFSECSSQNWRNVQLISQYIQRYTTHLCLHNLPRRRSGKLDSSVFSLNVLY